MRDLFTNGKHVIEAGKACSGIAENGLSMRVVHGRAWVTMDGVLEDYWLAAGQTLQAQPGHLTVVEADPALGNLELRIERPRSGKAKIVSHFLACTKRLASRSTIQATTYGCSTNCK